MAYSYSFNHSMRSLISKELDAIIYYWRVIIEDIIVFRDKVKIVYTDNATYQDVINFEVLLLDYLDEPAIIYTI